MQKNGYSKQESETRINHFNQDGTDNGYTELRTNGFGDKVWVHHDCHGLFIGESEWGTDIMGDDELIHRDKDGAFSGTSKNQKSAFTDETVVRDEQGFVTGTSINKNSAWEGKHKQHYTNTDQNTKHTSFSGGTDNALYSLLGKIVGGILAICAIIWLAVAVVLPLIVINAALVFFIWALFSSKGRKYLMPFATLAGIYVAVDFFYAHWFTKSLGETVTFLNDVIPWMVYTGILAGTTAAYFTIRNYLNTNNPERINEGEFSKGNLIIAACIAGTIGIVFTGNYLFSKYNTNSFNADSSSSLPATGNSIQSETYIYKYSSGTLEKQGMLFKKATYNSRGQVTTQTDYGFSGSVSTTTYTYDDLGNKIEETFPSMSSGAQHMVYKYDANRNQIESKTFINDVLEVTNTKKYDDKGHIKEEIYTAPNGNINYRQVYLYNEKGCNTEIQNYDNTGIINKYLKKCDQEGNSIEQATYNADGSFTCCRITYKYDQFHNITEQQSYTSTSEKGTKNEWKYDSQRRLIEDVYYYEGGQRASRISYKFADNGIESAREFYDGEDKPTQVMKTTFK